ncbi:MULTISPECIES: glycerate kinase [unclassified Oceanispirochaeta]|uniref:glycerate kinase family protein n=1 Tax=unclassified Oceanispirochaeta TaxID=2635722 RepID=UPI000E095E3D|nr:MULTISPECIES: glycerate kinase [unclassified Oceanispirochaeta]MBF9014303.1 glycerate kinase [Oceanispirochaeta sp. M2]NPD71189.1 glycerate kinase [Oceanispirochaeta sp. M1]RDG33579.1 glycerate kinase [Oceanispirochaeta sp. M1]
MKVVIASDSYKGSNTSIKVAGAIERGIKKVDPTLDVVKLPVADGGEGLVQALVPDENKWIYVEVKGPMGESAKAEYALYGNDTAVIEMASASGLPMVPEDKKDPSMASTYGTGQLMKDALDRGCKTILIGIGGSATNDGGTGMARALGVKFLDSDGKEVEAVGGNLDSIADVDLSGLLPAVKSATIKVACDVDNPLCGEHGASAIYGPQKGATPEMVKMLDANLASLAKVMEKKTGQDMSEVPGAGAAGGLGFGLMAFTGGVLEKGIDLVLDSVGFDESLEGAELVITGEGRIDGQSVRGKVPVGIAARAKKKNIPVLVIAGDIGPGISNLYEYGIDAVMSTVNKAMPLKEALERSTELLEDGAERAYRMIKIGMDIKS